LDELRDDELIEGSAGIQSGDSLRIAENTLLTTRVSVRIPVRQRGVIADGMLKCR